MLSAVVAVASLLSAAPALPTSGVLVQATVESRAAAFSVGVGQCARPKGAPKDAPQDCGVVVTLKRGGSGTARLEWSAPAGPVTKDNANSFVVAEPDEGGRTLTTRWSPVTVGNVNLKAGVDGLVVTQEERRNDRVRRRYDVFLARKGKLTHAFTGQEGRGSRTWSSLEPVDIDHDGGNELIFISSTTPDDDAADKLEVQIYGWRADVGKLVARNDLRPALKGGVIGMFKTIGAARALQDGPCSSGFLVLDNTTADMLGDGQVLLAWPAVLKADAELALETVKTCNPNLVGAVKELTGGVDIDAERDSE
jgi:hypothetical protein